MNDFLIHNIAQKKLSEINTLTASVSKLQHDVDARQTMINSFKARNDLFCDALSQADAIRSTALTNLNLAQASNTSAHALNAACEEANRQANEVHSSLSQIAEKKLALVRHIVYIASLLDKAGQLANKQKATNSQIPDTLISQLSQAVSDCANVVALALTAQNACHIANASMTTTHSGLALSQQQAYLLKQMLENTAGSTANDDSVLSHLNSIYKRSAEHYNAALTISTNATKQLDHANATLASTKARLASLQAGLTAVIGINTSDAKKK